MEIVERMSCISHVSFPFLRPRYESFVYLFTYEWCMSLVQEIYSAVSFLSQMPTPKLLLYIPINSNVFDVLYRT